MHCYKNLKRNLILVALRESISTAKSRFQEIFKSRPKFSEDLRVHDNTVSNIAGQIRDSKTIKSNLILLDDFPIYRWAVPNIALARHIASTLDAKVAVFSFRKPTKFSKHLYRLLLVDDLIVISLTLKKKLQLIKEYRQLLQYLDRGGSLIEYRINGIPIGLDIYESILRSGYPTVEIFRQKTYRIAYLGLKQFIFFREFFEEQRIKSVLVSHDNYIGPGLLAHMAFKYEVEVILANLTSMTIPEKEFQLYEKFRRYKIYAEHLNEIELNEGIEWAHSQLSQRISGSLGVGIKYQSKSAFESTTLERQTTFNNVTKILVLTHDFFDNPHSYTRMIFDDFLIWMEFLASISLQTNYEWYIKPHRDYSEKEFKILKEFINTNRNFRMVDPEVSFHQLKSEGIEFALTCHGTVGHELPLLGYTVVNASYNPHIAFDFNLSAKSKAEYRYILENINDFKIGEIDFEDIYTFYFIHHKVVQDDQFLSVSIEELDQISDGALNSDLVLDFLLKNLDAITKTAVEHLNLLRTSKRVYAFENFLPNTIQLKRGISSIVNEIPRFA